MDIRLRWDGHGMMPAEPLLDLGRVAPLYVLGSIYMIMRLLA